MNKEIKVSIACLTYNHEKYIKKALDSFLMQEVNFLYEILINDDCSTDATIEILKEYENKYPDIIKVKYHTENMYSKGLTNPSGVYNFPRARGKYIAMCEGDDYFLDKHKLQKQYDYMENNQDCSFCFHSAKVVKMDKIFSENLVRPYKKSMKISSEKIIDKKSGYPTASLFFRKEYVKELPEFYFKAAVGDIPLQIILANKGYAYYMDEEMSAYRIGDNYSWTNLQKQGDYILKQEKYFINLQNMYNNFDIYSEYKFSKEVSSAIKRVRFSTYMNTKKFDEILSKEYIRYFNELSFSTKVLTILEAKFPNLYKFIQNRYKKL